MTRSRVLFLDFGGTLVRPRVSDERDAAELFDAVLRRNGRAVERPRLESALEQASRELGGRIYEYLGRTPDYWRLHDDLVFEPLGLRGVPEAVVDELERDFAEASRGELYPDTIPALESLGSLGIPLGVISNHNDALPEILRFHRIDRFFRTVTYSQEAGAEKPDRRVFDLALARAGASPSEATHVGDSWSADYAGARAIGMGAIWLNRSGAPPPGPCESVRDLLGVAELVRR
jgi:HAD superfamily hydrolase (TIGR01549 family)